MKKILLRSVISCCLGLVMLVSATPSAAVDGRDFAGFFELKNVLDQGNVVSFNFSVRVFNYSDADVIGAYVVLGDSLFLEAYTVFQNVRMDYQGHVFLSGDTYVPAWEYDQWQRGGRPNLSVEYQDAAGNPVMRMVELIEMPLGDLS